MSTPRTAPPVAFLPEALKTSVPPTSRERLPPGVSVTLSTPPLPGLLLLLPRQPVRAATQAMANVRRKPETQRCMNPPRGRFAGREHNVVGRKVASVEGLGAMFQGFKVSSFKVSRAGGHESLKSCDPETWKPCSFDASNSGVVSKLKRPLFVASEVSGFVNLP